MKILILIIFFFALFCSCSNHNGPKERVKNNEVNKNISDILIGEENVTHEIAGSAYLIRASRYYIISKNDTSGFKPIFYESKDNGKIGITLDLPYSNKTETYYQRISEFKLILSKASKAYNMDSLKSLSIGRLILTGDLAIEITKEYEDKFGENKKISISEYSKLSDFLLQSKLAKDVNILFEPYSISVNKVSIEKAFFTTKDELIIFSNVSKDKSEIPSKIFDCITWINFRKK